MGQIAASLRYCARLSVIVTCVGRDREAIARAARRAARSDPNRPKTVEPLPVMAAWDAPAVRKRETIRAIAG